MQFSSLTRFDIDASNTRSMFGNCGRSVKRAVARHFQYGKARLPVAFPETTLLAFALLVRRAQDGCKMAAVHMDYRKVKAVFSITGVDVPSRSFTVLIDSEPEEQGIKALQQWFYEVAEGLNRVQVMMQFAPMGSDLELLQLETSDPEEGDMPEEELKLYLTQFNSLCEGDMNALEEAPVFVAMLASVLCPEVARETEARHEAMLNAIEGLLAV